MGKFKQVSSKHLNTFQEAENHFVWKKAEVGDEDEICNRVRIRRREWGFDVIHLQSKPSVKIETEGKGLSLFDLVLNLTKSSTNGHVRRIIAQRAVKIGSQCFIDHLALIPPGTHQVKVGKKDELQVEIS